MVYTTSPYTPIDLSDGDDDDLCVWDHTYDSDGEPIINHKRSSKPASKKKKASPLGEAKEESSSNQGSKQDHTETQGGSDSKMADSKQGLLPREGDQPLERQEVERGLVAAVQNLTMLSQYVLKLEVRADKTTKEAIRQTLDDTAALAAIDLLEDNLPQQELLQHIVRLSEQAARRMYLVDRHWRRQSSRKQEGQASQMLPLMGEASVKSWISIEKEDNHIMRKNPCYFTVRDLASGRKFRDWTIFLQESCGFKGNVEDDKKLLNLAWRFLDRDLRGEFPSSLTNVKAFVSELEDKFSSGQFEMALADPEKQEKVDKDLWRRIRRLWSARTRPH
ncbi:hypothetical protein SLS62_002389 [Diatrype stigma]|uniref:Uncharacterized protein n=1 Tax=Diatrype stigma TaxID=117547 RepID=A0AAN9UUC3_9PEZI